jgi:hypothetical protein
MNDGQLQTVERVRQFLEGSEAVEFSGLTAKEKYYWIEEVLIRLIYHRLNRAEKGVIRRYVQKFTGYSRSRVSRLIAEYNRTGQLNKTEWDSSNYTKNQEQDTAIVTIQSDKGPTVITIMRSSR